MAKISVLYKSFVLLCFLLQSNLVESDSATIDDYNNEVLISQCISGGVDLLCHGTFKVAWMNWKPYLYRDEVNTTKHPTQGVLAKLFSVLKSTCERKCIQKEIINIDGTTSEIVKPNPSKGTVPKYIFDKEFKSYSELMAFLKEEAKRGYSVDGPRLFVPVTSVEKYQQTIKGLPFIFHVETPGMLFVERTAQDDMMLLIWQGAVKSWPLFAMVVLLALLTGLFVWIFERKKNDEMFPKTFLEGTGVGFWFAFVTMTTVGYGDKSPRTLAGRIICLIWMIISLCLFPLLMANFTVLIQAGPANSLYGQKVAVVKYGPEAACAVGENARIVEKDTYKEVLKAVSEREVDAGLIGKVTAYYVKEEIESMELRITRAFECNIRVGAVGIPGKKTDSIKFIQKLRRMDQQCLTTACKNSLLGRAIQEVVQESVISASQKEMNIKHYLPMLILTAILVPTILIGLFFQFRKSACKLWNKGSKKAATITQTEMNAYSCRNNAIVFTEGGMFGDSSLPVASYKENCQVLRVELNTFFQRFSHQLQELEKQGYMDRKR